MLRRTTLKGLRIGSFCLTYTYILGYVRNVHRSSEILCRSPSYIRSPQPRRQRCSYDLIVDLLMMAGVDVSVSCEEMKAYLPSVGTRGACMLDIYACIA